MGFVAGFTGGVTITLGVAYLSVAAHQRHRTSQALYLRSQSQLLKSVIEPDLQALINSAGAEYPRSSRATFTETAKDRWNQEVENAVRRIQTTDWNNVREGVEGAIARLLDKGLKQSREGIEKAETVTLSKVRESVDGSKAAASRAMDKATAFEKAGGNELKEKAQADLHGSAGTVDAARGAVRGALTKGIERGQEFIGKAAGLTTEKVESAIGVKREGITDVERALRQRYEKLHGLDQSVEQALEDRYKPLQYKS